MLYITQMLLSYGNELLNALKNLAVANVNTVMLGLGIKVGEKMNVPFVTEGTVENNLKVTMECLFSGKKEVSESKSG